MKFGKRRWEARHEATSAAADATPSSKPGPASPSVVGYEPPARDAGDAEAIVDAEAVELPATETPPAHVPPAAHVPPPAAHMPPPAAPVPPFPVAEEPVAVVSSGPDPGGVTPLGEAGPFYASGHAHGTAPSWPEPVLALAAERPEVVVGAAFVGGILLAAIVRRLGN
jgi:hypothetical protein